MAELIEMVPIKVKILRKSNGHADYPDFNQVSSSIRKGLVWSKFIDVHGIQWHYNKLKSLGKGHSHGECGTLVPSDFAEAAESLFPDRVEILTEAEWETFYNDYAHVNEEDEDIDIDVLQKIKLKQDLGIALTAQQQKAIDPNDDTVRGIKKNKNKLWADRKAKFVEEADKDIKILTVAKTGVKKWTPTETVVEK